MRQNRFTIHRKFLVISVFGFLLSIQSYAGYILKNIPETPIIETSDATTICNGATATLSVNTASSPACAGTYEWSNNASGNSIVVSTGGSYSVRCLEGTEYSLPSNEIAVTVNPIPAAPVTSGGGDFCRAENSTATLTATGCDGGIITWSNGDTGNSIIVSVTNNYTATCEVDGCTSANSNGQQVNFFNTPLQPVILADGPTTVCQGESVTLRGETGSNFECFATLRWNTRETGNSINVTAADFYFATCSENGCSSENSNAIQVTVKAVPAPPTISGGGNFCRAENSTATLTATGCDGGIITWSNGSTGNSITVSVTNNYTATCEVDGCTSANSNGQQVNFFNTPLQPVIFADGPTTVCQGESVTLRGETGSNSECFATLRWNTRETGNSINVTAAEPYFATCEENGCRSENSNAIQVTVKAVPAPPTISGGGNFCRAENSTATLTATGCDGGVITWSNGDTGNSIIVSVTNNYTATCEVDGCTSANSNGQQVNFLNTPLQPVILADGPTTVCQGESVTLRGETESNFECFATLTWSTGETGNSINVTTADFYTATCSENGCVSATSNAIQVTVNPIPAAPVISGGGDFCSPTTTTNLTATGCDGGTITWSDNQTGNSITVSSSANYTATCTVNSCTSGNSNAVTVNFFTTPAAPIIEATGATSFCNTESLTIQLAAASPTCNGTINWSNGQSGTNNITVNTSETYTATCSENGCVSATSNAIQVTVNPIPAAPVLSGGGDFCSPTTTTNLTATGCDGGTITWSDNQTGNSITVSNSANYTATCTVNGCTSSNSNAVTVNFFTTPAAPIIEATGPTAFCDGSSVTIQLAAASPTCNGTLTWSNGQSGTNNITVNTSETYTVTCTVNGCLSAASNPIQITTSPTPAPPTVSGGGNFCFPTTSTNLTATGCGGGTITWSDNQTGNSITVSSSANYTATCTINGCTSGNSNAATVNFFTTPAAPIIEATGATSFCNTESVTIQLAAASPTCNGTLTWSNGQSGVNSITVNTSETYTATCSENGCLSAASNPIQITASPTPAPPTVSGGGNFCSPTTTTNLTATGCGGGTITWSDNQTGNSITVSNSANYTATCTENGCTSGNSNAATVNFFTTPAAPIIEATGATSFCNTESVTIQLAAASPTCNGTINWSNGQSGTNNITVNTSETYTATCSENGCLSAASNPIQITASPTPAPPTVSGGGNFCSPTASTNLTATGCDGGTITWSDNQTGNSITVSNSGNYTATCTVNGCTSGNSNAATVNFFTTPAAPIIEATGATSFCNTESVTIQLAAASPTCNGTINWSNGQSGTNNITVNTSETYTATCTVNGCLSAASNPIQVTASPTPAPPTVSGGGNFCSPIASTELTATGCGGGTVTWSDNQTGNSITVSNSANYTATCTVNGCTSGNSNAVTVNFFTTPAAPIIEATGATSFCNTESVTIQLAAASPTCNGTINWSNGQSGTNNITVNTSETYTATCSENGCVSPPSNGIQITASPAPASPTVSGGGNFCSPIGSTTLTATGCDGGTITWSDNQTGSSITVSSSGNYNATCEVNGCVSGISGSATVNFYTTPAAPIIEANGITEFCTGTSVTLQTAASTPVCDGLLVWSNGTVGTSSISVNTAGSYSVVCNNNGCISAASNPIEVRILPNINVELTKRDVDCFGANNGSIIINPSGGTGNNYQIFWPGSTSTDFQLFGLTPGTYEFRVTNNNGCEFIGSTTISQPTPPNTSFTQSPISCFDTNDGSIVLNASGGTPPYRYQINSGGFIPFGSPSQTAVDGLSAGTYSVTLIDANDCVIGSFSNISFINPNPITISVISKANPRGSETTDGTVTAQIQGGTTPFSSVSWGSSGGETINSSLNSLPITSTLQSVGGGDFTITAMDARNCIATATEELIAPRPLTLSLESQPVKCFGENSGQVVGNANGGVPFPDNSYEYTLFSASVEILAVQTTPTFDGLGKGNYTIRVRDANGITASAAFEITQPERLTLNEVTKIDNYCTTSAKGLLRVNATGGTPDYSFAWNNGGSTPEIRDLAAGNYSLVLTDQNACRFDTLLVVETNATKLTATLLESRTTCPESCDGSFFAVVNGGFEPYAINWSNFPDATNQTTISGLCPATETNFTVQDSLGCSVTTRNVAVSAPFPEPIRPSLRNAIRVCPTNFQLDGQHIWAVDYEWTLPDGTKLNTPVIEGKELGEYIFSATNRQGCQSEQNILVSSNFEGEAYIASPSIAPIGDPVVFVDLTEPRPTDFFWQIPNEATVVEESNDRIIIEFSETGFYTITALAKINGCDYPVEKSIEIVSQETYDDGGFPAPLSRLRADFRVFPNPIDDFNIHAEVSFSTPKQFEITLLNPVNSKVIFEKSYPETKAKNINIPVSFDIPSGAYLLLMKSDNEYLARRIVIR